MREESFEARPEFTTTPIMIPTAAVGIAMLAACLQPTSMAFHTSFHAARLGLMMFSTRIPAMAYAAERISDIPVMMKYTRTIAGSRRYMRGRIG